MVSPTARGAGAGRRLAEHRLAEARRLGFEIVGTLPGAFRHARLGFVDVYVMFKALH